MDADDDLEDDFAEDDELESAVTVEVIGLSIYTHHGITEAEREVGQRLVVDVRMEVGNADATVTDRIEDTVDYGEVCQLAALVAQQRSYKTLERLATAIAERIIDDFPVRAIAVKCAKPEPPIPLTVQEVSVEVWREAGE